MKLYSLASTPLEPVSHDPGLKKRVLMRDGIPGVKNMSHVILKKGDRASMHCHREEFEVLYCVRGGLIFEVEGKEVMVKRGDCLVLEPGEYHSIPSVLEDAELFYFKVPSHKR